MLHPPGPRWSSPCVMDVLCNSVTDAPGSTARDFTSSLGAEVSAASRGKPRTKRNPTPSASSSCRGASQKPPGPATWNFSTSCNIVLIHVCILTPYTQSISVRACISDWLAGPPPKFPRVGGPWIRALEAPHAISWHRPHWRAWSYDTESKVHRKGLRLRS